MSDTNRPLCGNRHRNKKVEYLHWHNEGQRVSIFQESFMHIQETSHEEAVASMYGEVDGVVPRKRS